MIGLSRLKRAIEDVPTGGMQTGDPKVRMKLCDAQRLAVEFNAIIAERDSALAQNAELVAKIDRMQTFIKLSARKWEGVAEVEPTFCNLLRVANENPQQCLRDRDAEVGRAGFVAGVKYAHIRPDVVLPKVIEMVACDYAEKVRRGEV